MAQLVILKTNLCSLADVARIEPVLNLHNKISSWNVDTEDSDHVLRIELNGPARDEHFIALLQSFNVESETLPD